MQEKETILRRFLQKNVVNMMDIGSSGSLENRWSLLAPRINLIGFDPNEEECVRQNISESNLHSKKFLPYALHAYSGEAKLYLTESIYCYSLLEPNLKWLRRFCFSDLFEYEKTVNVKVCSLDEISEIRDLTFDVLKIDVQGLEIPILSKSGKLLDYVFYIDTENGFCKNYIDETVFSEMAELLLSKGYMLFDINTSHRISRKNIFQHSSKTKSQLLWAESIWLKDYISEYSRGNLTKNFFTREIAEKTLLLCAFEGFIDYGLELGYFFRDLGLFDLNEIAELEKEEQWDLSISAETLTTDTVCDSIPEPEFSYSKKIKLLKKIVSLFPEKLKLALKISLE